VKSFEQYYKQYIHQSLEEGAYGGNRGMLSR
jgi:hypothetical protein